jgi:putative flippase GtrA
MLRIRKARATNVAGQFQRFVVSGLLVTGFHVLIAMGLIRLFALSAPLANGIAFIAATVFSYFLNTMWSFSRALQGRNLIRFICVSIIGCVVAVSVSAAAERHGLTYMLGIALVAIIVPPMTFLLHRFWTYR